MKRAAYYKPLTGQIKAIRRAGALNTRCTHYTRDLHGTIHRCGTRHTAQAQTMTEPPPAICRARQCDPGSIKPQQEG